MSGQMIAFVFPGQGSQQVGMLSAAYARFAVVRDTFSEASQILGYDVWKLIQSGPQESLNLTETTQPILLASSVALWRAWQDESEIRPAIMAGHSLGEFSALVCARSLNFSDALNLVRQRGQFMQTAVPFGMGAMAAVIGLGDAAIRKICEETSNALQRVVAPVNFNSPGQVVIAGHTDAVDTAIVALKHAGAKMAVSLPVSAPFHTTLMKPAGDALSAVLSGIAILPPEVPVVHNVHAATESDPGKIRELLVEQIYSPVLWTDCIRNIMGTGAHHIVECGPGKVLSGLNRRIDKGLRSYSLEEPDALMAATGELV